MKGFLKILKSDFDTFNANALEKYKLATGDESATEYTTYREDSNSDYVWVRVEHDFIEASGEILLREDAIEAGMVTPTEES